MLSKEKSIWALQEMGRLFPEARCELEHRTVFELLIAVILSAQTTDKSVNRVTPALFAAYPDPEALAAAPVEEIMEYIRTIGLYRNKAKNIQNCCRLLLEKYQGKVPQNREELMELPGVGRKTANVVLSVGFGIPAFAVDTHVERVSKRLRMVPANAGVLEVEQTLMKKVPRAMWSQGHHQMIFFGRYHCTARSPHCELCPLWSICAEGQKRLPPAEQPDSLLLSETGLPDEAKATE